MAEEGRSSGSVQVLAELHQARWQHRMHGQRRRPGDATMASSSWRGDPANFLDVAAAANAEQIKNAFRILMSDKNVKAVLITSSAASCAATSSPKA